MGTVITTEIRDAMHAYIWEVVYANLYVVLKYLAMFVSNLVIQPMIKILVGSKHNYCYFP